MITVAKGKIIEELIAGLFIYYFMIFYILLKTIKRILNKN